jgi:carboxylesterase
LVAHPAIPKSQMQKSVQSETRRNVSRLGSERDGRAVGITPEPDDSRVSKVDPARFAAMRDASNTNPGCRSEAECNEPDASATSDGRICSTDPGHDTTGGMINLSRTTAHSKCCTAGRSRKSRHWNREMDHDSTTARKHEKDVSCLLLHGLGGGPYELEPLIEALKADGIRVASPIMPGHEGPGPLMPASNWRDWARSVESAFDDLASGGRPVAVIGFSTGATLALHLASRRPVTRQVLLAPFLAIRYSGLIPLRPATYLRALARFIPNLRRRAPAVRDREMRRWAAGIDRFRTFNVNAAISALELIDTVRPLVPAIKVPTLIIQGRLDSVVEPSRASWLHQHLGASEKTLVVLRSSDHLVSLDRERDRVIALTRDFVQER